MRVNIVHGGALEPLSGTYHIIRVRLDNDDTCSARAIISAMHWTRIVHNVEGLLKLFTLESSSRHTGSRELKFNYSETFIFFLHKQPNRILLLYVIRQLCADVSIFYVSSS